MNSIDILNSQVKLRLAPSKIHGIGVFAVRDISRGEKVYADQMPAAYKVSEGNFSKLFPFVQALLLERWPQIKNGSAFVYPDARMLAYMNHADEPNYDAISDLALTDIKAGEEITEDYKKIEGYQQVFPWIDSVG